MASGGYRPNSGPAKGTKYRPRAAKQDGEIKPKQRKERTTKPLSPFLSPDIAAAAEAANLTPLEYMLKVMNDATETDKARKDRMAIAAAPFCHVRKGEGAGKKDEKADRAKSAASGKFAASKPPIALVK